jgi:uncharacterized membrane protein
MFKKLFGYFLKGLLLLAPIGITALIVWKVFVFFSDLLPTEFPLIAAIVVFIVTTILGFLATTYIQDPLTRMLERTIEKIPLVKFIYTSIRDLLSAFMGNEKRFTKPVMVKISKDNELYKLGFVTQENLEDLGISGGMSAVYMPHSYNFSGNLFIVGNDMIKPIETPSDETMKFIVSGGITKI